MEVNHLYGVDFDTLTPMQQVNAMTAQNNSWSAAQAQKQMDFQREMSDTAHQREVADLKAAGLNPVLSAKLGGASTPSGAMGTTDTSGTSALVDLLTMAMETANSAAGAAYNALDDSDGFNLFGWHIDLSDYKIKNPRKPGEIAYNFGLDWLNDHMPDIGAAEVSAAAKALWKKLHEQEREQKLQPHHGRQEAIEEGQRAAVEVVKTLKGRPTFVEDGKKVRKAAKSTSSSAKAASAAGITGALGGLGMIGSGLGNRRYGQHPQLQF